MKSLIHFVVFVFFQILLASFQTAFWFQIFGPTPPPQLWLLILVYWSLYRSTFSALPMLYIVAAVSSSMSSAPAGSLLLLACLLFLGINFFKSRIYWSGPFYYLLICGLTSLSYPILYFLLSWIIDDQPIRSFEFFHWIFSSLLTMAISMPIFRVFVWIDETFEKRPSPDSVAQGMA